MSSVFQAYCVTCDRRGPKIRRVHDKAVLHAADQPATEEGKRQGEHDWGQFLLRHEFHEIHLRLGP